MPAATPDGRKVCSACQVNQPVTEFHSLASASDGLYAQCKACRRSTYLERRAARLAYAAARQATCGEEINARRRARRSDPAVRQEINARRRSRWAADPEPARVAHRAWWAEHGHEVNARRRASEQPREPSLLATPDGMKVCRRCRVDQPVTEFHRRTHVGAPRDGRCPYCKSCKRARPWTAQGRASRDRRRATA